MSPNPIINQLSSAGANQTSGGPFDRMKNLIGIFKNSKNPQEMVTNMLLQNPEAQEYLKQSSQNGGTYKDAFFAAAKAKGIDPNQIINMLK